MGPPIYITLVERLHLKQPKDILPILNPVLDV